MARRQGIARGRGAKGRIEIAPIRIVVFDQPDLPVKPPVLPMLAKRVDELPAEGKWIFEPKWDGFRALVFRDDDELEIQSRDEKPLPEIPRVRERVVRRSP